MNDSSYAQEMDSRDTIVCRNKFNIPLNQSVHAKKSLWGGPDKECVYFCGNSLGLMPKSTRSAVDVELDAWASYGVNAHFEHVREPWVSIDRPVGPEMAKIVGAQDDEVAVMNTLTGNLHAALSTFYKPDVSTGRTKIMYEDKAFPSDNYAFMSQCELHGLDPAIHTIKVSPKPGTYTLTTEQILEAIDSNQHELALVCFSGIQFYTGQLFDIETITAFAHERNILVGWDLAHAAGNVELKLHDWRVDFAVWCTYKYLNSGPGGIAGLFVHSKHVSRPRQAGWWGNNPRTRFDMLEMFDPIPGAEGFRMSNPSVLNMVCVRASLEIFKTAGGMSAIVQKSKKITGYLYDLLLNLPHYKAKELMDGGYPCFEIITPESRGTQLSLLFHPLNSTTMQQVMKHLNDNGIIADERKPNVIRLAPTPLYNTYSECLYVAEMIESALNKVQLE
ncbi:hypothetical protein CANCADRAFT_973 [Tortispora caseinolytica NRRL Y-17796]|uniref:Kynureninase n=1 Tax=Tortispora caseinolytica NRRL Y-17796 TaxID=767744 RepID=A0A1E4TKV4_9ASCO|nr:hypothetical protein CANCADRAFT_973 [Tortispora caseinolytica NRRL Y-17796]